MYHVCVVEHWIVVGSGRCGLQLARHMIRAGITPIGICVRSTAGEKRVHAHLPGVRVLWSGEGLPYAEAVLLAVPDMAIASVALQLRQTLPASPQVAIHTSGLLSAIELAKLWQDQPRAATMHPLVSFPNPGGALVDLSGVLAAIEGNDAATPCAKWLASTLGMTPYTISAIDKPLYHAAATIAANLTYILVASAKEIMKTTGLPSEVMTPSLHRLVHGSVENALLAQGYEKLTGPLVRGDEATVQAHLGVLGVDVAEAYRAVARLAVSRLVSTGQISEDIALKMLAALTPSP